MAQGTPRLSPDIGTAGLRAAGTAGHPDASDLVLGRQNQGVPERLLTPSKITAWLDCPHFLTLRHEVDSGVREQPPHMFGEMAQMLMDKGIDHELQVLARYEAAGRTVHRVAGEGTGRVVRGVGASSRRQT